MNVAQVQQSSANHQGAMQAAILAANKKEQAVKAKPTPAVLNVLPVNNPVPMILLRTDLRGQAVIFFGDSVNQEKESIFMWDMQPGSKPFEVNLSYYKSTKVVKPESEEGIKMIKELVKEFDVKEMLLRERLTKKSSIERDEKGNISEEKLEEWKKKLIAAVTKTIMEL